MCPGFFTEVFGVKVTVMTGMVVVGLALISGAAFAVHTPKAPTSTAKKVSVVYAGSLAFINDEILGPKFQKATGVAYQGQGGGSFAMAKELASHLLSGDVFESIGTQPIADLEPSQTTWAVRVSATPLVIAYNPKSPEASYFKKVADRKVSLKAFFAYLASHHLNIGRTDPETDPQGQAFYEMVELAVRHYGLPKSDVGKILGAWNNPKQIYSEEGLPTELQSGGLDLSSAFLPEVIQDHMDYIKLPPMLNFSDAADAAWYAKATLDLPNGKVSGGVMAVWATALNKSVAGAQYVSYVVHHESLLKRYGYQTLSPVAEGTGVPRTVPHV